MLWLCLYFPLLPLEVFTRAESNLSLATVATDKNRILCANQSALDIGITPGQSVATASALSANLRTIARDAGKESQALDQLAAWCYRFSPMVSLLPPDALVLEIAGSLQLFKGLANMQTQIDAGLTDRGYSYRRGLAHTPKAALLFAHLSTNDPREIQFKASQIIGTPDNQYFEQLKRIPLHYLDTPRKHIQLFRDMGLSRLGELLALPRHAIGKRFGTDFLNYLQQIIGERPDPQQPISLKPHFSSDLFYIDGIDNTGTLLFPAKRLLSELCQFLKIRQLACRQLNWSFAELKQKPYRVTISLSRPQNSLPVFLEMTRIKLENLSINSTIHSISLCVGDFNDAKPERRSLFNSSDNSDTDLPQLLIDKLATRLGEQALQGIELQQEHAPERAWRAIAFNSLKHNSEKTKECHILDKLRPPWLFRHPVPIQQRDKVLYWQGRLTLLRGPERIECQWWVNPGVQRDYFIARHERGGIYWLFRDLHSRRWFVHGVF